MELKNYLGWKKLNGQTAKEQQLLSNVQQTQKVSRILLVDILNYWQIFCADITFFWLVLIPDND